MSFYLVKVKELPAAVVLFSYHSSSRIIYFVLRIYDTCNKVLYLHRLLFIQEYYCCNTFDTECKLVLLIHIIHIILRAIQHDCFIPGESIHITSVQQCIYSSTAVLLYSS